MIDRIVISSDDQARYNDPLTEQAFLHFVTDFKPQTAVKNGDLVDLQALGKFRISLFERQSFVPDIEAGRAILANLRSALPDKARLILTAGNHEERLVNYLKDQAAELEGVPGLTLEEQLDLPSLGVEFMGPYGAGVDWHSIFIYHGKLHTKTAAAKELANRWTSGVSGHTQRLAVTYFTDGMGNPHAWFEDGCMCRVDPEGAPPSMRGPLQNDWQQGFVIGEWQKETWALTPIHIHNHEFIYNGNLYTPKGVR
jgi:hypothetical protein